MAEPVASPLPKPVKKKTAAGLADDVLRPQAALLYPALKQAGEAGLSWRECWALLGVDAEERRVGRVVTWMRFHSCEVMAFYVAGETRFRLL